MGIETSNVRTGNKLLQAFLMSFSDLVSKKRNKKYLIVGLIKTRCVCAAYEEANRIDIKQP